MRRAALVLAVATVVVLGACTGPDPNLTESGKGKPVVTAEFPETASPGDVVTAIIRIENPGPEDMDSIVLAFARVGDPSLPLPIVEPRPGRLRSGIEAMRPEPNASSPADATYTFDGIPEGETKTIELDLRIPDVDGPVGNIVQVYDGAEIERARGTRIQIEIE